ncbi:MAG: hypothetical protein KatS3mg082_2635 [Nitrospiraceae bacterium]|nr:MAG: hypothetical protein KatS3mg082_2635 [Nitrospiraceae bacterium]
MKPSVCRLSSCSRLIDGWKLKSKSARVFTAGRREERIAAAMPAGIAQRDLGTEQRLDGFGRAEPPAIDLGEDAVECL